MQGLLLKIRRKSANVLMLVVTATLVACAKDKQPSLVDDSATKNESSMPWNKQEKWETQGQLGGITDRR
jgi:outer membrane biogenesis lipoprotein LolB